MSSTWRAVGQSLVGLAPALPFSNHTINPSAGLAFQGSIMLFLQHRWREWVKHFSAILYASQRRDRIYRGFKTHHSRWSQMCRHFRIKLAFLLHRVPMTSPELSICRKSAGHGVDALDSNTRGLFLTHDSSCTRLTNGTVACSEGLLRSLLVCMISSKEFYHEKLTKENSDANAPKMHSMLLSLPAHLRSIILQLVLGGRTVHIDGRSRGLRVRLCIAAEKDDHAIRDFKTVKHQHLPRHYQIRHTKCWSQDDMRSDLRACLAILLVCRQLYTEAAMLPFSMNAFAFDGTNGCSHEKFLHRLRLPQRNSIRRVHFGPQIFYLQAPFEPMERLTGLREVILFLKDDVYAPISGDSLSGERTEWLINRLCNTKCPSLRAIRVCISSEKVIHQSSKSRMIHWAQALENQMHCTGGEPKVTNHQLVLRCRPGPDIPGSDSTAAISGKYEAFDRS